MNIRKPTNYSAMYAVLDRLMVEELPQVELYFEIGRAVCARTEKGAAVAASEYLQAAYPETIGFSPRNLRRMREFFRIYENVPELRRLAGGRADDGRTSLVSAGGRAVQLVQEGTE